MSDLRPIEPLDSKRHHAKSFDCGQPSLNRWLQSYAGQSQRRDVARTFVVTDQQLNVVGYYTLVAGQVEHPAATPSVSAGASRHFPIPVCLLARVVNHPDSLRGAERWDGAPLTRALRPRRTRPVVKRADDGFAAKRSSGVASADASSVAFAVVSSLLASGAKGAASASAL